MRSSPDYPVPALEKGLDIVEALAEASVPQSLAELATRLKRSSSELFRMLNCLERRGYVTREPLSGKFGLSLKLFALAHAHSPVEKLRQAAERPMIDLAIRFRVSCHLSVLEKGRLLVVAQEESPEPVRLSIEVGGVFDPLTTASGRLLLALLSPRERATALAESGEGKALAGRALTQLEAQLEGVRRAGLSSAESETIEGVRDFAVSIGAPGTGVCAALAVTRLRQRGQRGDDDALLHGMRTAAHAIAAALGIQP